MAYLRPSDPKPIKQQKSNLRKEPKIDKKKLSEFQQKLAESKKKEKQLNDEVLLSFFTLINFDLDTHSPVSCHQ